VTQNMAAQEETKSNTTATPEKAKRETSLPMTVSEAMPQLPSLLKTQSTNLTMITASNNSATRKQQ